MLDLLGKGSAHTCTGVTRRDFLQVGTLGTLGFGTTDAHASPSSRHDGSVQGQRSCILIFNLGAPSQLDTFDMKPEAPAEIRGPFKPISTKVSGLQLSEILPRTASIADKIALVRSCFHRGAAVHDAGWQIMQTGRLFSGGINTPHVVQPFGICKVRAVIYHRMWSCPKRWAAAGATCRTDKPVVFWVKRMIRLP